MVALTPLERMLQIDKTWFWGATGAVEWNYSGANFISIQLVPANIRSTQLVHVSPSKFLFHDSGTAIIPADIFHFSHWRYE